MKKTSFLILIALLLFPFDPLTASMRCDFNADGKINVFDLLAFLKHLSGTELIVGAEKDFINPKPDTLLVVDTVTVSDTVGVFYYFSQLPDSTKHPLFGSWEIYWIEERTGLHQATTIHYNSPDASGLISFSETSSTTSTGTYAVTYRKKNENVNQIGTYQIVFNVLLLQDVHGDKYSQEYKLAGNELELIFGNRDELTLHARRASP